MACTVNLFWLLPSILCISVGYAEALEEVSNEAQFFHAPYQVSIRWNRQHLCGGSIITNRSILTTAHCVDPRNDMNPEFLHVVLGTNYRWDRNATNVYRIQKAVLHESYAPGRFTSWRNDIAIIKVDRIIEFNELKQPILLPNNDFPVDTLVTLTGWGKGGGTYMEKIPERIISNDECRSRLNTSSIQDGHICALPTTKIKAAEQFSGGPLVNGAYVGGILSFGRSGLEYPNVYTRVYHYLPWIRKNLADLASDEEDIDPRK